jgi:hypothetical protein
MVRAAVEGRSEEAAQKLQKAEKSLRGGLITIGIFTLLAFLAALLSGPISFSIGEFKIELTHWSVSFAIGLIAGLPRVIGGLGNIRGAREILAGGHTAIQAAETKPDLKSELDSGRLIEAAPPSVTEQTTKNMKVPQNVARKE